MLEEYIYPHRKIFETECSQIEFWDELLSEFQEQFKLFLHVIDTQKDTMILKNSSTSEIIQNFHCALNSNRYSTEPSNLFLICKNTLEIQPKFSQISNDKFTKLCLSISPEINEIIETIRLARENLIKSSDKTMSELKSTIENSKMKQKNYDKIKSNLNDLHTKKKKLDLENEYAYNIAMKERAEKEVINKFGEMENLLPSLQNLSNEIDDKKEKFNKLMIDNFEIVFTNVFKCLTNLYQCFFLYSKTNYDVNYEIMNILQCYMHDLSKMRLNISEYTERKYGASNNLKIDNLDMINLSNEMFKDNLMQIDDTCKIVINYMDIFYQCLRYRKKIIKQICFYYNLLIQLNEKINNNLKKTINTLHDKESNLKILFEFTNNSWSNIFQTLLIDIKNNTFTLKKELESYVKVTRTEQFNIKSKWEKYSKKLIDVQSDINKLNNKINIEKIHCMDKGISFDENKFKNKIQEKAGKAIEILTKSFEFINSKVKTLREEDIKRLEKIVSLISELSSIEDYQNKIDCSEKEIKNSTSLDIFDVCQDIFINKYFQKFQIENYEFIFDKIKMKILHSDFINEKLGKATYSQLNDFSTTYNINMNNYNNELNDSEDIERKRKNSIFDLDNNNNEFAYIHTDSKNNDSNSSSEENNNKYIIKNKSKNPVEEREIIFDNYSHISLNENKNKKQVLKNKKSKSEITDEDKEYSSLFDDEKMYLIKEEKFDILNTKNVYQNFKEQEIKDYKTKLTSNQQNPSGDPQSLQLNLDPDEEIIKCYTCAYKLKILLQGKLTITNKNLFFISVFNSKSLFGNSTKLKIPLLDIKEVAKKTGAKMFPNSIKVITEKTDLFFTSFVSRDKCYSVIIEQLNRVKGLNNMMTDNNEEEDLINTSSKNNKSKHKKLRFIKCKQINKMISDIELNEKLEKIKKERMEEFIKKYRNNVNFLPPEEFVKVHVDEDIGNCPLCLIFSYLFNPTIPVEDNGDNNMGFFESIYKNRGDYDMIVTVGEKDNFVPQFFGDIDYVMELFSEFKLNDFNEFLESVSSWNDYYKFNIKFIHPIKQYFIGPDRVCLSECITSYFISPTCMIVEDMSYGIGFPFSDTFIPITQYQFDTSIKFNISKGQFEFKTHCTIRFLCRFIKNCALKKPVGDASYSQADDSIKVYIFDKMKTVIESKSDIFNEMLNKMTDENLDHIVLTNEKIGNVDINEFEDEDEDNIHHDINLVNEEPIKDKNDKKEAEGEKNNIEEKSENIKKGIEILGKNKVTLLIAGIILVFLIIVGMKFGKINFNKVVNALAIGVIIYLVIKVEKNKK